MLRLKSIVVLGCVWAVSLTMCGCAAPAADGNAGDGNNSQNDDGSSSTPSNEAAKSAAGRVVMAVIAVRNEDRRAESKTLSARRLATTACPFGGSRTTDDDITTFMNCGMLPGVTLNGRIRFTPGPEGTQGGRIEFFDLEGTNNGNPFMVDGTIEETENADGSLSFEVDVRTSTTSDGETDEFNVNGNVRVNEDGAMEGDLHMDQGEDDDSPNDCDLTGVNILELQNDENALDGPCGFDKETLDDDEDDGDGSKCDCAPGEECIEFEGEDGTMQAVCSNCKTNQDCVDAGLGNECSLGFSCTTVECFTDDDCPDGFECDGFLGGGDCVEESFFFP